MSGTKYRAPELVPGTVFPSNSNFSEVSQHLQMSLSVQAVVQECNLNKVLTASRLVDTKAMKNGKTF